jgi:hypothetical protein
MRDVARWHEADMQQFGRFWTGVGTIAGTGARSLGRLRYEISANDPKCIIGAKLGATR